MRTYNTQIFKRIEIYIDEKMDEKSKKKKEIILEFFKNENKKKDLISFLQKNFSDDFFKKYKIDLEIILDEINDEKNYIFKDTNFENEKKALIKNFFEENKFKLEDLEEECFIDLIYSLVNPEFSLNENEENLIFEKISEQLNKNQIEVMKNFLNESFFLLEDNSRKKSLRKKLLIIIQIMFYKKTISKMNLLKRMNLIKL